MSIRGQGDAPPLPLVGDGPEAIVPTPSHREYEVSKVAGRTIIDYATHHGVPRHVPLCESSKTAIHKAVEASDPATLCDLLETDLKEKIDQQNYEGFTALHYAAMMSTTGEKYGQRDPDRIACCQLLIEAGAKLDIPGQWGQTPLQIAAMSHYPAVEVIKMLVDAKANILHTDEFGGTAVHCAAYQARTMQLKELLKHPDAFKAAAIVNKEGDTALSIAERVYKTQEQKVELSPHHCEAKLLLEGKPGLSGADTILGELGKSKGKGKDEASAAA